MGNDNNDFVCVGFDIRTWPNEGSLTADATEWPRHSVYDKAKSDLGYVENIFQLIHVNSQEELENLHALVKGSEQATLISIELSRAVVDVYVKRYGFSSIDFKYFTTSWEVLGFDVCDANGFFSILHMEVIENISTELVPLDSLISALTLAQAANVWVPSHSPFVVTKLARRMG